MPPQNTPAQPSNFQPPTPEQLKAEEERLAKLKAKEEAEAAAAAAKAAKEAEKKQEPAPAAPVEEKPVYRVSDDFSMMHNCQLLKFRKGQIITDPVHIDAMLAAKSPIALASGAEHAVCPQCKHHFPVTK